MLPHCMSTPGPLRQWPSASCGSRCASPVACIATARTRLACYEADELCRARNGGWTSISMLYRCMGDMDVADLHPKLHVAGVWSRTRTCTDGMRNRRACRESSGRVACKGTAAHALELSRSSLTIDGLSEGLEAPVQLLYLLSLLGFLTVGAFLVVRQVWVLSRLRGMHCKLMLQLL